jgi:hypothetical protein
VPNPHKISNPQNWNSRKYYNETSW